MAIASLDDLMDGFKIPYSFYKFGNTAEAIGRLHSLWYAAGTPGAGTAPASGMAGAVCTKSTTGALIFTNAGGGEEQILSNLSGSSSIVGTLYVIDRLWEQSGIVSTTTTGQTINSISWPARDRNGSVNGEDVFVALEVRTATTNGGTTLPTITYTNSAGTDTRTGTVSGGSFPATAVAGTFIPFLLAAGDIGVQSVQSITLNTSLGTGVVHLVAYRIIAELDLTIAGLGQSKDAISLGKPLVYDDSCLQLLWMPSSTVGAQIMGRYNFSSH